MRLAIGHNRRHPIRFTLNTDGRPHPRENAMAIATLVCGLVAFVTGFIVAAHMIASWVGTVGFWGGLYAQFVSSTTRQRALIIVGIVGSFVGAALGIVHGGFFPRGFSLRG
ncbi:hypothetical protein GCM10010116_50710 [Microbispora rosea subsp. aerata]|nr:hypothetical protein [Microbispora rosea]GGO25249.1 hypothetical protein GCM10010116_50710 [Microbispora rosea subsp. aerata]GIH58146.1 hypothetical protein Mro02_50600 [Microbispora rosea subsp. aerata]GLJ85252.1 hypothetical protein GCM10017588_39810 [Microbispora rosea subsp. aerata]